MSCLESSTPVALPSPSVSPQDIRSTPGGADLRRGVFLSWIRRLTLLGSDILFVSLAWISANAVGTSTSSIWSTNDVAFALLPVLGVSLSILEARYLYRPGRARRNYLGIIKALSLSAGLLLLINYFYSPNQTISRTQFILFWAFSISLVCAGRFAIDQVTHLLRLRGAMCYSAMVIADPSHQERAVQIVNQEQRFQIVSLLEARALDRANREETFEKIRQLGIAEVFVAWDAVKNRMFLGQRFQALGITLHVLPVEQETAFGGANLHMLTDQLPCVSFLPPTITGVDFWLKRAFDITFASLFLVLTLPVYLVIAIAIRLDSPGPIFYKQPRAGLHAETFKVWKFRSMVPNADKLQAELEAKNDIKDGVLFKMKKDPRITRVGNFIRRYSLDELPQIFNVLRGEMSLVGPRPLPLRDVEKFEQHYFIRQDVLPGITGMWQVSGRSDIDNFDEVLRLDLFYIQNWSIWLDISILFRTFSAVLQKSGAY